MLSFKTFIEKVKAEIHLLCEDSYQIIIEPVPQNNGTEQTGIDIRKEQGEEFPLYVLSNRNVVKGAAVILYDGLLKEIAKSLENDLLILPSSVHEVLVMAYDKEIDFLSIRDMVEHINKSEVSVCDVLSNQIYRYSREKDQVSFLIVDME